jgi:hypothetical protein
VIPAQILTATRQKREAAMMSLGMMLALRFSEDRTHLRNLRDLVQPSMKILHTVDGRTFNELPERHVVEADFIFALVASNDV